ncbi:MAG: hypothetical protein AAGG44_09345 [Planctomycetota bacterium]
MTQEETPLIDPSLLVRVKLKAHKIDRPFTDRPEALPDESILPCLSAELAGAEKFAQVRVAVGPNAPNTRVGSTLGSSSICILYK